MLLNNILLATGWPDESCPEGRAKKSGVQHQRLRLPQNSFEKEAGP